MTSPAELVGVLDLMDGHVVRAIGGRRDEYRPVVSRLCPSSKPLDVARAFRDAYGIDQLYVADLDAIRGGRLHAEAIDELAQAAFRLTLDAGFRTAAVPGAVSDLGVECLVAAVESLAHADELEGFVEQVGAEKVRFSIDLAGGVPLAEPSRWKQTTWTQAAPFELALHAAEVGVTRFIVLDLQTVGTGTGPSTMRVCRDLKASLPTSSIWTGGGVRDRDDVIALKTSGANGILVASALHDRTLERDSFE